MRVAISIVMATLLFACAKDAQRMDAGCDDDSVCRDSDCDTICDRDELSAGGGNIDSDHDGTPDHLDSDSDNDGVPDVEEAGDRDPTTPPVDDNHNGIIDARESGYPCASGHACSDSTCDAQCLPSDAGRDAATDASLDAQSTLDADVGDAATDAAVADAAVDAEVADAAEPSECLPSDIVAEGCIAETNEVVADLCDGADNDCDSHVDEGCECFHGTVQACFAGPPGRRAHGACRDGTQACVLTDELVGTWGPCVGGIQPSAETCDGLDNDCNGCRDEIEECAPAGSCPGPGDPRVREATPFETYALRGADFYGRNDVKTWRWRVKGPPCDRMFASLPAAGANATNGRLSHRLRGANRRDAELDITLSGAYEITLTVTRNDDSTFECTWIVNAHAPGLRVELCWPNTGATALSQGGAVDLDLHLGTTPQTTAWDGNNDCYWRTCVGVNTPWSYPNTTNLSACTGPLATNFDGYQALGYCPNPRLDIDNRDVANTAANNDGRFITENINLDNPGNGQRFRVLVDYFANALSDTTSDAGVITPIATEPLVNVYCDGTLLGTFGGDPDLRGDDGELTGFDSPGQQWRVVDIETTRSNQRLSCALTPLTSTGVAYDIRSDDSSY